jgi:hypothetical protein
MIILRGSCYLEVDKEPLLPLVGGDFVLLPSLKPYSLRSEPKRRLRPIEQFVTEEEFRRTRVFNFEGGENPPVSVIVGCFNFEMPESELLIKHLAPVISLRASDQSASPWFQSTLHFIAAETSADLPGATAIVDRLAEVLFIQAMRACIQATYPPGNPNRCAHRPLNCSPKDSAGAQRRSGRPKALECHCAGDGPLHFRQAWRHFIQLDLLQ